MVRATVAMLALVACGRLDFEPRAAAGGDAARAGDTGGSGDAGSGSSDCWAAWGVAPPALTAPIEVVGSAFVGYELGDPSFADGGLTLYVSVGSDGAELADSYTTRATTGEPFDAGLRFAFDTGPGDSFGKIAFAADSANAVVSAQLGSGTIELWTATRAPPDPAFPALANTATAAIDADQTALYDPDLSADGLTLRYAPVPPAGVQEIYEAQRGTLGAAFTGAAVLPVAGAPGELADPSSSPDGLTMLLSSAVGSVTRVGYASRPDATSGWTWQGSLADLASGSATYERDAIRAPDGCSVWFISTRDGGVRKLFEADVVR
jgi:hypothetical protein